MPMAPTAPAPDLSKAARMGTWGFDLAGRDTSTMPAKDFFQYANGTYEKTMVIPADRVSYGAFDSLNELSQARLHSLLDKTAANTTATGEQGKVGALYRSFMDETKVNALGAGPTGPPTWRRSRRRRRSPTWPAPWARRSTPSAARSSPPPCRWMGRTLTTTRPI